MKNKKIITAIIVAATLLLLLTAAYLIGTGLNRRTDILLDDFSVSADGTEILLYTDMASSMGFTRGFKDLGGGVKPHYLVFYSTFGGLNSQIGAKNEHILTLEENDTEIYFNRPDGGYQLVLKKDEKTGKWIRP